MTASHDGTGAKEGVCPRIAAVSRRCFLLDIWDAAEAGGQGETSPAIVFYFIRHIVFSKSNFENKILIMEAA